MKPELVPVTKFEIPEVGRVGLPVDKTSLADEDGPVEGRVLGLEVVEPELEITVGALLKAEVEGEDPRLEMKEDEDMTLGWLICPEVAPSVVLEFELETSRGEIDDDGPCEELTASEAMVLVATRLETDCCDARLGY